MLIAASALDLARCSLVVMATRHYASAAWLIAAGIGAAAVSMTAARACGAGRRWAGWAALVIGVGSAPQASVSGFCTPYAVPDAATAALGILLSITVLATAGRPRAAGGQLGNPWDMYPAADAGLSARSSSSVQDRQGKPCAALSAAPARNRREAALAEREHGACA